MDAWSDVILEWVNCLQLVKRATSFKDLELGKFIHCFFTKIDETYTCSEDDVWNFMEKFLSSSCRIEQLNLQVAQCHSGDEASIVLLLSSLLVHHILECKHSDVLVAMSTNLSEQTQVTMKAVLEIVLTSGTPVTGDLVKSAFNEATRLQYKNFSQMATPLKTSTPKSALSSPLVALLQSPLAQQQRDLSLKSKEIKRLQEELAAEIQEKFDFVEQVEAAEKEARDLKALVHQRDKEIEKLKQDLILAYKESPKKKCHIRCRETHFKDEVKKLESEINGLYKEIGDLSFARDALEQKLAECKSEVKTVSDEAHKCRTEKSCLQQKLALVSEELAARVKECEELREIMASGNAPQRNVSSYESFLYNQLKEGQPKSPENLGEVVVDVMLQEKAEENTALSERLDSLKAEKREVDMHLKAVEKNLEMERLGHQAARDQCSRLEVQVKQLEINFEEFRNKHVLIQSEWTTTNNKLLSEQRISKLTIESYKEEVTALTKTIENVKHELENSVLKNSDLLQKSGNLMEKIVHLETVIAMSEENVKHLKDNVKQRETLAESQSLKILELLEEQSGFCQQIELLKASYTETLIDKQHLQVLKDSLAVSSDENLNKWSHHCEELMRKNDELTSNLESMRSRLEKVTFELTKNSEASNIAERCLKTTIDDKELVIKTLADNKLLLEQSLAESEKERNALQDCNVKLCEEMGLIEEKLHNMTEKYTALQNKFNELELIKCGWDKALEAMQQEKDFTLAELNKLKEEFSGIESRKIELEGSYNNIVLANEIEVRKQTEKYASLQNEFQKLKLEKAQYADKVASLELHLNDIEMNSVCTNQLFDNIKTNLNGKICNLQSELSAKQSIIESYVSDLEDSKNRVGSLQEKVSVTVRTAKLSCDQLVSATSLQLETFVKLLEEKLDNVYFKLSMLTDSYSESSVSAVLGARQLALRELEIKNEKYVKQVGEVKEQFDKTCRENTQLKKTLLDLKAKFKIKEQEVANLKKCAPLSQQLIEKAVRLEFEAKLDKAKAQMEKLMTEQSEKMKRSQMHERKVLQDQISELQTRSAKEKKTAELYKSRFEMLNQTQEARKRSASFIGQSNTSRDEVSFREKSKSRRENLDVIQESFTYSRSRRSTVPSETSPVFCMEDEEGELYSKTLEDCDEVFSKTHLEALKEGRCELPDKHRLGELQYRNSLCPPHLKSSYPAETQFSAPSDFKDEDLKMGSAVDIDQSMRLLQSGERHRRKEKGQTSYNKPGPPTPGKNGRQSLQGYGYTTPRSVLGEHNDSRRVNTPSRIKEFFTSAFSRRDENTPMTPRSRRMSLFRKQMKN